MPLRNWSPDDENWLYRGRPVEKSFLYEIVANKTTGIDVDKFDYLKRDSYHLNVDTYFKHERFMIFVQLIKVIINVITISMLMIAP